MNKRKINFGGLGAPFKRPRQRAGAAMYQTFSRAGVFARPTARRAIGMMSRRNALEMKGVDTNLSLTPIINTSTTNGSSFLLNAIAPGSGSFNRIGRKASLKTLRIKGGFTFVMTPSANGSVQENSVRMVIIWDKQPNSGAIPTWDLIFGSTDQAGTETSTVLSPLRYDNMDRFQVLRDKSFDVPTIAGNVVSTAQIGQFVSVDEFLSLKGRETTYSGQSATCTTADISTGALYVYFRAQNNAATATVNVDADTIARLRYLD